MAEKMIGQTVIYNNPPHIVSHASVAGYEESKGPFGKKFDLTYQDNKCGQKSWEKGEKQMVSDAINLAFEKGSLSPSDLNYIIGGDILNQIIIANYIARDYSTPFIGIYGACSTMVEGLALGSSYLDGGFADCVLAFSSSHYQTAERQYRTPLEYGDQYPAVKQWTVTGAGAYIIGYLGGQLWITHSTFGKVVDLGIKDTNDLGSAMAPAAADTILQHFRDISRGPQDYDLILTGDLGKTGLGILRYLLEEKKIKVGNKLNDCGAMIFGGNKKYGSGGSGCAASSIIFSSVIIPELIKGKYKRVLLIGTGALLSPLIILQKETIPGIAHGIVVEKIQP